MSNFKRCSHFKQIKTSAGLQTVDASTRVTTPMAAFIVPVTTDLSLIPTAELVQVKPSEIMRRNSFFLPMTRLSKLTIFDRVRRKMQEKIRKRERLNSNGQGTDAWRPRQNGNGLNHHLNHFRIRCFILLFKLSYLGNNALRLQRV